MFAARQCARLAQTSLRRFSTNRALKIAAEEHPGFKKLKANQELFQREDLVEDVFVKRGARDEIFYRAVVALTVVGLALDVHIAYKLATN